MATSGSTSVKVSDWTDLVFRWERTSYSVANNTSTISWVMELVAGKYGQIIASSQSPWTVVVNGTEYTGKTNLGIENYSTKTLASGSQTITHNADGSKSFAYSFKQTFNITFSGNYISTLTGTGTGVLDTIPRASQPSCITWPEHTQNVGYFGDTISIHMNRNADVFTHTVRYAFGSKSGTCINAETGEAATGITTGFKWKIPESFMDLLPAVTYGSGTIYVDTYNGSTKVGTKYCGFTATVPASVKPSCTFTLEDITGIDDIYGSPVQGLSQIKITVTPKTAYSSPIASYQITADGVKYSTASATTGLLRNAGTSTVKATVTDKRGRSGSVEYDMNVQEYTAPVVTELSVRRCDEDGTENDQGEYVKATLSAAVSSMGDKNTALYYLSYKKSTDTTYTTVTLADIANTYSVSGYDYIFAADGGSSYDVEVTATDRHGSASRSTSASTAFTLMHWHTDGTGMGLGKLSEKSNTLEVALDAEFSGKVYGTIFDAIYPVGSIYLAYNHIDPGTLFGGTWERLENAFLWSVDSSGTIGQTGGESTHTLTIDEIPRHSHGPVYSHYVDADKTTAWLSSGGTNMAYGPLHTGGGEAHNNMPPYIQISAWRRTA